MKITLLIRKSNRRLFIDAMVKFYIKFLKLEKSKYDLIVLSKRNQIKETGGNGITGKHEKTIIVSLDSNLNIQQLMLTVAHEMVHVKQIATGKLNYDIINKKEVMYWCGKQYKNIPYLQRPWEIQAFASQELLVRHLENCFN